jgi:hypothetical protein
MAFQLFVKKINFFNKILVERKEDLIDLNLIFIKIKISAKLLRHGMISLFIFVKSHQALGT